MWGFVTYITMIIIIVFITIMNHNSLVSIFPYLCAVLVGLLYGLLDYFSVRDLKPKRKQTNAVPEQDHVTDN
jgi:hypothetical protein